MKGRKRKEEADRSVACMLRYFDLIADEIGKHEKEDSFMMDCPSCGAVNGFGVAKTVYSAAGWCSVCGYPVHIKFKR